MTPRRLPYFPTLAVLVTLLAISVLASLAIGSVYIAPKKVVAFLLHPTAYVLPPETDPRHDAILDMEMRRAIIYDLRLTRTLLAALVGVSLAVAGVALQGLLGNALAEPYTIGVSSGAAVGAGLALWLGLGATANGFVASGFALAGALLTLLLVFLLARGSDVGGGSGVSTAGFLLAGVAVGAFLWALLTLILSLARTEQQAILQWLMGRLNDADWPRVWVLLPVALFATFFFTRIGRGLDAFAMLGEEQARSIGVSVERFKMGVLFVAALATAVSVSVAGIVAFVGLIVPHCGRALVGPEHRRLVPVAALLGASLTVVADLIARVILPGQELPVGVVTSLLGAPFFAVLLRAQMGR